MLKGSFSLTEIYYIAIKTNYVIIFTKTIQKESLPSVQFEEACNRPREDNIYEKDTGF